MEALRPEWSEDELSLPKAEKVETPPEPVAEKPQAFSFAGGELATEAMKKLPEAKLVHVEQAAKRGDAIELDYERRQEVRDEPSTSPAPDPARGDGQEERHAVSVGSVIAKQPYARQEPAGQNAPASSPHLVAPAKPEPGATNLYGQAIKTGFLAALMIIVTFSILLILT